MTRRTNARIAGFTFFLYIAAGLTAMVLSNRGAGAEGTAAKLAYIAQHASETRVSVLLNLLCGFCALVLGVTLYAITRDEDSDVAMLAMTCRVAEGVIGAASLTRPLAALWLATAGKDALDPASANALGAFLLRVPNRTSILCAIFFAVGSTLFAWLFLRGRMVPIALAWLGVFASILIGLLLPLQLVGILSGPIAQFMWMPMLAFELWLGLWLIIKGAALPTRRQLA